MAEYKSNYTGQQIDNAISKINDYPDSSTITDLLIKTTFYKHSIELLGGTELVVIVNDRYEFHEEYDTIEQAIKSLINRGRIVTSISGLTNVVVPTLESAYTTQAAIVGYAFVGSNMYLQCVEGETNNIILATTESGISFDTVSVVRQ